MGLCLSDSCVRLASFPLTVRSPYDVILLFGSNSSRRKGREVTMLSSVWSVMLQLSEWLSDVTGLETLQLSHSSEDLYARARQAYVFFVKRLLTQADSFELASPSDVVLQLLLCNDSIFCLTQVLLSSRAERAGKLGRTSLSHYSELLES